MKDLNVVSTPVPPVSPDTPCGVVFERFQADSNLVAIPVTVKGVPKGLLKRTEFLIGFGDRFGRALFEKRPVTALMDSDPLMVDERLTVERLHEMLISDNRDALQDGFIVTEDGFYKGIGTSYTLLQLNMKRAEQRMLELDEARMEAEAATRSRSQFLANMSHELRTPLNAVIGFADFILAEKGRGRSVDDVWTYVADIRDSGTHLLGVINSILDFSKLEANAFNLREDYEAPQEIIHRVVRMMTAAAKSRSIRLMVDAEDLGVELHADIQVTKQILINLVSNAIKFSPSESEIHVSHKLTTAKQIEFVVLDNGPGMSEEVLDKVMEPFEQADAGLARRHEGTGLGLPLVKAFTEAHGGTFRLESAVGSGTRGIVTFPPDRTVDQASFEFAAI